MTKAEFHNALRILHNIDAPEFWAIMEKVNGDVLDANGKPEQWYRDEQWKVFRDAPASYFIRCGDDTANALFDIIKARLGA